MGYNGACRREELTNMDVKDIHFKVASITVHIPKTKTHVARTFLIIDQSWINLIRQYFDLRPKNVTTSRFFLTYRNGHCINSPVGLNTMGKAPSLIAKYLCKPNPECFTGHCFRRSSVTELANKGSDLVTIKRHGGWKSSAVAEGYIENSLKAKMDVAQSLSSSLTPSLIDNIDNTATPLPGSSRSTIIEGVETAFQPSLIKNGLDSGVSYHKVSHTMNTQTMPEFKVNASDTSTVTLNVYNNCTINNA